MQYKISIRLLTVTICLFLNLSAAAQNENPFIGTWDLNIPESNFGGAAVPENMARTYADLGDGRYMYLVITLNPDGSLGGSSATYQYDGGRYPIAAVNQVNQAYISYRKINERTVEYTVHAGGQVTQIGAKTISPDGRVLQIAIQFPTSQGGLDNQILVFDRR